MQPGPWLMGMAFNYSMKLSCTTACTSDHTVGHSRADGLYCCTLRVLLPKQHVL